MSIHRLATITALGLLACSGQSAPEEGDTSFISTPPGASASRTGGAAEDNNAGGNPSGPPGAGTATTSPAPTRTVEETDIYRLDGDRLYFLNAYRGLMVFDVADLDHPKLLGRAPIFGSPVEMVVRNGIAVVVVADWYGALVDGTPFHGSVVRGFDATDPRNIRTVGEATLGGWVTDTRVVGDVLYAVSVDYGWTYGWLAEGDGVAGAGGTATTTTQQGPSVVVSSVSFAGGAIRPVGHVDYPGWGGVFHVTASSVLLAHDADTPDYMKPARTELQYLDISDPGGAIVERGKLIVDGRIQGWGADNGRWNLDFADGKTAHLVACAGSYYYWCGSGGGYVVSTVDFSDPDAPALRSDLDVPAQGWSIAARFVGDRLYLAPDSYDWNGSGTTPFQIVDLANPAAPKLMGTARVPGAIWNLLPGPDETMFALGNEWRNNTAGSQVSLSRVDVVDPAAPSLMGTARFGDGWAWTPAAGTFKAFAVDADKGLVVLPFSGWSTSSESYTNGLQLVELEPDGIRTSGAARTRGWVERGIFVRDRLVALSDLTLSVVDYRNRAAPAVVSELTLARNVVAAEPHGTTLAQISTDFWDNDVTTSELRILPIADAEELRDPGPVPTLTIPGTQARPFRNGDLAYLVSSVRTKMQCDGSTGGPRGDVVDGGQYPCWLRTQQVQVVDLSGAAPRLRGKVTLPADAWGWGWWGYWIWGWYNGSEVVQVDGSTLAFRRWEPIWAADGKALDEDNSKLYVVDLADPDNPALASVDIVRDANAWWGNMRVVGTKLYTGHYEWQGVSDESVSTVRYYADRIDLRDPRHPRVEAKINVPGIMIGGSENDPSVLYFIDYRWDGARYSNDLDVVRVTGETATLLSRTSLDGWSGEGFVRGSRLYLTVEKWEDNGTSRLRLHAFDLSDPRHPRDQAAAARAGWGWLLDVEGDRALVTSGWGGAGIDIYKLQDGQAPVFERFVRTRGWWTSAVARQGDTLFLASGGWGVQKIDL